LALNLNRIIGIGFFDDPSFLPENRLDLPMRDAFVLTPFFLDHYLPALQDLIQPNWILNKPALPEGDTQTRMSVLHEYLAREVKGIMVRGDRPVSIVGDCCATIGFMAGIQRVGLDPTLLWFDAHGDFNTWKTTPSGFLGGMPLAMLVGRGEQRMPRAVGLRSVPEGQVILTDARDLDPGEQRLVESSKLMHLPKITDLLDQPLPNGPLYIHFDVDVVNPDELPAVSYPAPGGPSVEDIKRVFNHLIGRGSIVGISMSTWNPDLDEHGRTKELCMEVFNVLLEG
jgi:arginase